MVETVGELGGGYVPSDLGGDGLAGAAPCGEGVEDDDGVLRDRLLELVEAVTHGG
jgi:hypothetical protein